MWMGVLEGVLPAGHAPGGKGCHLGASVKGGAVQQGPFQLLNSPESRWTRKTQILSKHISGWQSGIVWEKVLQQLIVSYKKNLKASLSDGAVDFGKVKTMPVLLTIVCLMCLVHGR